MKHMLLKSEPLTFKPEQKPDDVTEERWDELFTFDYVKIIDMALRQRPVGTYNDVKTTGKILKALKDKKAGDNLVLDDQDFDFLRKAVDDLKFHTYDEVIEAFLDAVNNPKAGLPDA